MTVFVDWITIQQTHFKHHDPVEGNYIGEVKPDGSAVWAHVKPVNHPGSHETSIQISSDGYNVRVSGNPGRFNRPDNIFSYGLNDTIQIINSIIGSHPFKLPPFTSGESHYAVTSENGKAKLEHTGAHITRLDLTRNYALGSIENARTYIAQLSSIKVNSRQELRSYNGSVYWGKNGTYKLLKMYIKSDEIKKHLLRKKDVFEREYIEQLVQYLEKQGTVRLELQLGRILQKNDMSYLHQLNESIIEQLYEAEYMKIPKELKNVKFEELNEAECKTLLYYASSMVVKDHLPRSTYYKHRKKLLQYGVDISIPVKKGEGFDFSQFYINVKLQELKQPAWYRLPSVDELINKMQDANHV